MTQIPMKCQVVGAIVHPIVGYLLVSEKFLDLGIKGVAITWNISSLIIFLSMVFYTNLEPSISECLFWPDMRSCMGLKNHIQLSF